LRMPDIILTEYRNPLTKGTAIMANGQAFKHEGYDIVPLTFDGETIGWNVPALSRAFGSEEEAMQAVNARIQVLIEELRGRF